MKTLKISLFASAIGTLAWAIGLTRDLWPAHPLWAAFLLTLGATIILSSVPGKESENDQ
jgi:hypothetical protein